MGQHSKYSFEMKLDARVVLSGVTETKFDSVQAFYKEYNTAKRENRKIKGRGNEDIERALS